MIRSIVAIDEERGLANDHGIPWQGKIPRDGQYFADKTVNADILMGYKTYLEFQKPLPNRHNFVLTHDSSQLRAGFTAINDIDSFITTHPDAWIIGGAGLYEKTLSTTDELYITQLKGTYQCLRFFPEYATTFHKTFESEEMIENGISYTFQIWQNNLLQPKK